MSIYNQEILELKKEIMLELINELKFIKNFNTYFIYHRA